MKRLILKSAAILILAVFVALATLKTAWAFPSGWRLPFYNDGRAMISNGPGEGMHTGASAQAVDFLAMDTWASTKDVRAPHPGTVKLATTYSCSGKTLAI